MTAPESERRSFIRVPFSTKVEAEIGGSVIRSQGRVNVSMSGIRIAADDASFAPDTPCAVKIILSASDSNIIIEAKGSVIRCDPESVSIKFTELDIDSYQHLRQLILYNTENPEKAEKEFHRHNGIRARNSNSKG